MQALFSSFYVNLNILVENLKTPENGGFKPFLGLFSCVPFLQIGEIPIFLLYIVACFWKFCHLLPFWPQTFVQVREKTAPLFLGVVGLVQLSLFPFFGAEFFSLFPAPWAGKVPFLGARHFPLQLVPPLFRKSPGRTLPRLSRVSCPTKPRPVPPPRQWTGSGRVPRSRRTAPGWLPETPRRAPPSGGLPDAGPVWRTLSGNRRPGTGRETIPPGGISHTAPRRRRTRALPLGIGKQGAAQVVSVAMAAPRMVFYSILWRLLGWGVGCSQSPWSMAMARAGLSARNTPVPAMSTSAPACRHRGAVSRFTPPSTLMSSRGNRFFSSRIFSRGAL